MKQVLDAAGVRTPRHASTTTVAGVWEAAERIGYPIIVKPIAGAGSADTYRVDSPAELSEVLPLLRHVPEVSVEEFVDGEEFTFDTVCADGKILFENVMWYRPRPLQMRLHEWISPVSIALRDLSVPDLQGGRAMGAPGARRARLPHRLHAHGVVPHGGRRGGVRRDRRAAARGPGRGPDELRHRRRPVPRLGRGRGARAAEQPARAALQRREHLQAGAGHRAGSPGSRASTQLRAAYGDDIVLVDILPIGAPRRDWRATVVGDGWVVVRHHELQRVIEMTERFATDLQVYATDLARSARTALLRNRFARNCRSREGGAAVAGGEVGAGDQESRRGRWWASWRRPTASRGPRRDPTRPARAGHPSRPAARRARGCWPRPRSCPPTCPARTPAPATAAGVATPGAPRAGCARRPSGCCSRAVHPARPSRASCSGRSCRTGRARAGTRARA